MTHSLRALACLAGSLAVCAGAAKLENQDVSEEIQSDNPYQAIVERNVFGLKPPPPPPDPESVKPPAPKITLTGVATILGRKQALMKTPPAPVKAGETSKGEQFYTLAEGQRDGDLEVLQIDEKQGIVKVSYAGQVSSLDFTNNGAKFVAGPPPGVVPGAPGAIPAPPGGQQPGTMIPMPTRTLRLPTPAGASGVNPTTSSYQNPGGNLRATPYSGLQNQAVLGTTAGTTPATTVNPTQQMPVENQFIMIEAERERTRSAVSAGLMPPLPPTPLSPLAEQPAPTTPVLQRPQLPRPPGMPLPQ